jgi:hypothetical protein
MYKGITQSFLTNKDREDLSSANSGIEIHEAQTVQHPGHWLDLYHNLDLNSIYRSGSKTKHPQGNHLQLTDHWILLYPLLLLLQSYQSNPLQESH